MAMQTISYNIANVNTSEYTRQKAVLEILECQAEGGDQSRGHGRAYRSTGEVKDFDLEV